METLSFKEWEKLDLRVGKILNVENHPNADKLFLIGVDLGELGKRKLVAGLKKYYSSEELIGKKCIVFVNLKPAEIRGVKSEGMILAALDENGEGEILSVENVSPGSKVK